MTLCPYPAQTAFPAATWRTSLLRYTSEWSSSVWDSRLQRYSTWAKTSSSHETGSTRTGTWLSRLTIVVTKSTVRTTARLTSPESFGYTPSFLLRTTSRAASSWAVVRVTAVSSLWRGDTSVTSVSNRALRHIIFHLQSPPDFDQSVELNQVQIVYSSSPIGRKRNLGNRLIRPVLWFPVSPKTTTCYSPIR